MLISNKNNGILYSIKNNLGLKFFITIVLIIFVISASFTALFVFAQKKTLSKTLIKNGKVLTSVLARNVRLGVFTENKSLIRNAVQGAFQCNKVVAVRVYNADGKLIEMIIKKGWHSSKVGEKINRIPEWVKKIKGVICVDEKNKIQFWSPVCTREDVPPTGTLPFENNFSSKKQTQEKIGYVNLVMDKTPFFHIINRILINSVLLCIIFLAMGSVVIYYLVSMIIKPLNMLISGVKSFGETGNIQRIDVNTNDEVGRLADAFNDMIESLKIKGIQQKKLEEQLRQAQKMEAVGTLAGGVAHDFNNILSIIIGNISIMKMKMSPDFPLKRYLDQIEASAERAANLTKSLLLFSRQKNIDSKPLDLNHVVKDIKKLLERLIREDVTFNVDLVDKDLIINADAGQISQMLMNLVTNAMDAMKDGGSLEITTDEVVLDSLESYTHVNPGRYAVLSVKDTGDGIPEEILPRIFEPFFTTKEVGKGTGLGLSMVFGIVKKHNGYIEVKSKPGEGTTFHVYFPLVDSIAETEINSARSLPPLGSETVLIAEDDMGVRSFAKEALEGHGYKVIEAIDGEDAIIKFSRHREEIDILLLDVVMPKKNGRLVYEEIRKIKPNIRVLFMSGYTADVMENKGIDPDNIVLISKPVSAEALLRKLREVLDMEQNRQG